MVISLAQATKMRPNFSQKMSQLLVSLLALTTFLGVPDAYCGKEDDLIPASAFRKNINPKDVKEAAGLLGVLPIEILGLIFADFDIKNFYQVNRVCQYVHFYVRDPLEEQIAAHLQLAKEVSQKDHILFEKLKNTPQENLPDIHVIARYFFVEKSQAVNTLLTASSQQLKIIARTAPLLFDLPKYEDTRHFVLMGLLKSEDKNQVNSHVLNAIAFLYGKANNDQKAVELLKLASAQGYAAVQYNLGTRFVMGFGVEKNYQKAVELLELASAQGYAAGQNNLGVMYAEGLGVEQNYQKALGLYRLAAAQGHAPAQNNLGEMYVNGQGGKQNYRKAAEYFELAAAQGNIDAQFNLGVRYFYGHGVEQNYQKATEFFKLAADQGYDRAQYNLGVMYDNGHGAPQDEEKAVELYRIAAEQGHVNSQSMLAHKGMAK